MNDLFLQLAGLQNYLLFFLLLLRIGGFMQTLPIFSSGMIPPIVKIFISIVLAVFFYKFYSLANVDFETFTVIDYGILAIREVAAGVLLGMLPRLVFFALLLSSEIISNLIGLSFASVYNPQDNQSSTVIPVLIEALAVLFFISLGYHHFLIEYIFSSYEIAPPLQLNFSGLSVEMLSSIIGQIFILALVLSAPIVTISFMVNVGLGFANRTISQLNVFLVGTIAVIILGLLFLGLTLSYFLDSFKQIWLNIQPQILEILQSLRAN